MVAQKFQGITFCLSKGCLLLRNLLLSKIFTQKVQKVFYLFFSFTFSIFLSCEKERKVIWRHIKGFIHFARRWIDELESNQINHKQTKLKMKSNTCSVNVENGMSLSQILRQRIVIHEIFFSDTSGRKSHQPRKITTFVFNQSLQAERQNLSL